MAEKTTIARPYAQAVFELAQARKELPRWSEMLHLAAAVVSDERIATLVGNPRVSKTQLAELLVTDDVPQMLLRLAETHPSAAGQGGQSLEMFPEEEAEDQFANVVQQSRHPVLVYQHRVGIHTHEHVAIGGLE